MQNERGEVGAVGDEAAAKNSEETSAEVEEDGEEQKRPMRAPRDERS